MASLFKRRVTTTASDMKHLSESEAALAQSSYNIEKITEIQNRFTGGEVLLIPGRIFIREGMLWKVCRKGVKRRQFFLFNDVLVYGSIVARGRYSNQHILLLSQITVESSCHYLSSVGLKEELTVSHGELDSENAFQVNHIDKSFHVVAQSRADKTNWLTNLQKQIKKLETHSMANDHLLFKAVWVPDSACKECLLCKQKFNSFVRKHHCRMCGRVVCSSCSPHKADIARLNGSEGSGRLERVCSACFRSKASVSQANKPGGNEGSAWVPMHVRFMTGEEHVSFRTDRDSVFLCVEEQSDEDVADRSHDIVKQQQQQEQQKQEQQDSESSETDDSDDSEAEITPVPPPRRKRLQKKAEVLEEQFPDDNDQKKATPPAPRRRQKHQKANNEQSVAQGPKDDNEGRESGSVEEYSAIENNTEPGLNKDDTEITLKDLSEQDCDPVHEEKTELRPSRSPSSHARIRKSKFTSSSNKNV